MKNFWIDRHNKKETDKRRKAAVDIYNTVNAVLRKKLFAKYFNPYRKP